MLTALTVDDFKSYRRAELPIAGLTVLIGANASGKSNLIEALQLLSWLARGRRLSEILYALKERQIDLRGSLSRLAFYGESNFAIGCRIKVDSDKEVAVSLDIDLQDDGLHLRGERALVINPLAPAPKQVGLLYEMNTPRGVGRYGTGPFDGTGTLVSYSRFKGGRRGVIRGSDQQAIFTQLSQFHFAPEEEEAQAKIAGTAKCIQSTLESIVFLDPVPRRMRDYSFTVDRILQGDGYNLSAVLYDLCERQQRKSEVLDFVRALPEQDFVDVTFLRGPREEVMVQLTESFGGRFRTCEAAILSDGTLRVLSVAAALLSVPEGTLVVVEEIDNGVHPTRAKLLLDNIQRVARARKLRVLLTTHNPALLDAIPTDAIPDVVACYRDPNEGDSRLMPLRDLPDYPELVAQGPVGQLVTRGILERYLKHPKTPEEKAVQAEKVLEMLQTPPSEP